MELKKRAIAFAHTLFGSKDEVSNDDISHDSYKVYQSSREDTTRYKNRNNYSAKHEAFLKRIEKRRAKKKFAKKWR